MRALLDDPGVDRVLAAPGNAGIAEVAPCEDVAADDPAAVTALVRRLDVDLVVVGPEVPLVAGVADAVRAAGTACFGPSGAAARLEGSKAFAKEVMAAAGVPTAMARLCTDEAEVADALDAFGAPHVVKDDGLAAGKGVVVTGDRDEALAHARRCLEHGPVVVEEFLDGPEVSVFCVTDGETVLALAPAQDSKRAGDGDTGPNTGGMGAYSPLPWAPADLPQQVVERIAQPVVTEMARRGTPFTGVLYCGLALTSRGVRVIEFNVRFGDPETQVVLARLATPLGGLLHAAATGALDVQPGLRWREDAAVTVVLAAPGYPEQPQLGGTLHGLDAAAAVGGTAVLHAGTRLAPDGTGVVASGGRVLSVVGTGRDLGAARAVAYEALELIDLEGSRFRRDIALSAATASAATA